MFPRVSRCISSNFFVSSRQSVISLESSIGREFRKSVNLCGETKKTQVSPSSKIFCTFFNCFASMNPKKVKRFPGTPTAASAQVKAEGPGILTIGILCRWA